MSCATINDFCSDSSCVASNPDFCSTVGASIPCPACGSISLNNELNAESNTGLIVPKFGSENDWYLLFYTVVFMIFCLSIIHICKRCIFYPTNKTVYVNKNNEKHDKYDIESQANYHTFTNVQSN